MGVDENVVGIEVKEREAAEEEEEEEGEEESPIEQVRLTVSTEDDPTLPVWTFRMWFLGIVSCVMLSFLNQFISYRSEPIVITLITVQVTALPVGKFMEATLPTRKFRVWGWEWSFNPGPFNMKEHVLITIFANAGSAFGNGPAYAVGIVNIIKAFYKGSISFLCGWLIIVTTQVLGYGWAGLMKKYVIEPAEMWWPSTLVQVSVFRALHEKDSEKALSRGKFFLIALTCSFAYYVFPGYLFQTLTTFSWVCWVWPKSVKAQQIGSGSNGLGVGSFALDWSAVAAFLYSPLISPAFTIVNVMAGYVLFMYFTMPIAYWGTNLFNAKTFPIYSYRDLYRADGQIYNITAIVDNHLRLDMDAYEKQGQVHLSMLFAVSYGFGFAAVTATITHVLLFYGKEIWKQNKASMNSRPDIHTRLMRKYPEIPQWWFYITSLGALAASLVVCFVYKETVQLPWWGLLLACLMAFAFTLPISVITATTNQTPGLNVITELMMGYILPGKAIANVCFKVYGYMSMSQAVSFLQDFKLGHYMKIPPRSMFLVQVIGTIIAGTINIGVAWWLLSSIHNICDEALLPANSPWTCPNDNVFYDASIIWGLVGPERIFGKLGVYSVLNWFFLGGALAPVLVWLLHKAFPTVSWIPLINMPVLLGATAYIPPAAPINYTSWIIVGIIFNVFVFKYRKAWWRRYNYVLSAGLDAGVAFMSVLIYFALSVENSSITWWGTQGEHCPLASCPTAKGVQVDGCPVF